MSRDTQEFEMKRRQFFKHLKERKLFTKYCLAIAQAYAPSYKYDIYGNKIEYQPIPKDKKEEYILLFTKYDEEFFEHIKKWYIKPNPMIQP